MREKAACLWSGGKDSCFACYKAQLQGYKVLYLLNFTSEDGSKSISHGLDSQLIALQVKATEITLVQRQTSWGKYEEVFKNTIDELKQIDVKTLVFGDIYLQGHKDWIDKISNKFGFKAILPLWKLDTKDIVEDFINQGFEAIVVSAKKEIFTPEWLGRKIDRAFIEDVRRFKRDIDLCGESGEFHSFVIDGPSFKKRIKIMKADKTTIDGYHSLDVKECRLEDKSKV